MSLTHESFVSTRQLERLFHEYVGIGFIRSDKIERKPIDRKKEKYDTIVNSGKERKNIMQNQFSRTELLVGKENMERFREARVAVFGIGGVGGYAVEALARSGIGTLDLIDDDKICLTNLNRQIFALHSTVGRYKVDVAKERILDINPEAKVNTYKTFFLPENADQFDFSQYDYVIDAIDTVSGKIEIIVQANKCHVPVISSMGAGNKMNPAAFEVADIYETSVCPLARVMRRELKKRGIDHLKVVYSREKAMRPLEDAAGICRMDCICPPGAEKRCVQRRQVPGSTAFVPSAAGLIAAGEVIRDLMVSMESKE